MYQLWTWLPAFRAVGESRHLPTASEQLRVSASALSRSIKQLEEDLGCQLFGRGKRGLELTDAGEQLLSALRTGMRAIDEGIGKVESGEFRRRVTIATSTPFARELVLPAVREVGQLDLTPHIQSIEADRVVPMLENGSVDLVLMTQPPRSTQLIAEPIMEATQGVYCGRAHPLFGVERVDLEDLLRFPFVGPPIGIEDGWPPQHRRHVTIIIAQLALAIDACAEGDVLGMFPDLAAQRAVDEGVLHRLPVEIAFRSTVYAVRRAGDGPAALDRLLAAIVRRAEEVQTRSREVQNVPSDTVRLSLDDL